MKDKTPNPENENTQNAHRQNKSKMDIAMQLHDESLRAKLGEVADKFTIDDEQKEKLIQSGMDRFLVRDGKVVALGFYESPEQLFTARMQGLDIGSDPKADLEKVRVAKNNLFEKMKYYASHGHMSAYRKTREQWLGLA